MKKNCAVRLHVWLLATALVTNPPIGYSCGTKITLTTLNDLWKKNPQGIQGVEPVGDEGGGEGLAEHGRTQERGPREDVLERPELLRGRVDNERVAQPRAELRQHVLEQERVLLCLLTSNPPDVHHPRHPLRRLPSLESPPHPPLRLV